MASVKPAEWEAAVTERRLVGQQLGEQMQGAKAQVGGSQGPEHGTPAGL